jgi:hypothetical protein
VERLGPGRARFAVALLVIVLVATVPSASTIRPFGKALAPPRMDVPLSSGEDTVLFRADSDTAAVAAPLAPSTTIAPAPEAAEAVLAPPPETFDAEPAPPAPPPSLLRSAAVAPAGGTWAVVIGIDDYPGSRSDLRASVYDANAVDYTLASYGITPDRRLVLRNTQASAAVIKDALRWLVARAGPDATAVFFYAGHVRKVRAGTEAIVAADGKLVSDREVADLLRPMRSRAWIVIAACYGGGFDEVLAPNRILTGAAPSNSLAYENATYANSYLVEYLFERAMMKGQAPDSVEQSYAWAYASLQRDHPNRLPVSYDRLDGELRIGNPPPKQPQSSAPPPSGAPPSSPPPSTAPPPPEEDDDDDGCLLTLGAIANCDPDQGD